MFTGTSDGSKTCLDGDVGSKSFTLTITWLSPINFSDASIYLGYYSGSSGVTKVEVVGSNNAVETNCGTLDNPSNSQVEHAISCG